MPQFAIKTLSTTKLTKIVDTLAYAAGIGGNVVVIPQIIKAWQSDAPGLAITTWLGFLFLSLIWLAYGLLHNSKPLVVAQFINIGCNILVLSGWAFNNWL